MGKIVVGIVVLAVLLGGVGLWVQSMREAPQQEAKTNDSGTQPQAAVEPTIIWAFTDAGEQNGVPSTHVMVVINGTSHDAGKYAGTCNEIGDSGGVDGKGLLAGEISAAQCYFAGGGDEIGVFANENGGFDIMAGTLDEGDAEHAGTRGGFHVLVSIK
jgi:hypothetical protein